MTQHTGARRHYHLGKRSDVHELPFIGVQMRHLFRNNTFRKNKKMRFQVYPLAVWTAMATLLFSVVQADAATYTYGITTGANNSAASGGYSQTDNTFTQSDFTSPFTRSLSGSNGASGASADIFADPATGEIKLRANAFSVAENRTGPRATSIGSAGFTVFETYSTTGTGSVVFNVAFDGVLDANVQGNPFLLNGIPRVVSNDVTSNLTLRKPGFNNNVIDRFGTTLQGGVLGLGRAVLDETTTQSLVISGGESFDLVYQARVSAGTDLSESGASADALAGFFNTFTISYQTTGTLQIAASDPAFLAGAGPQVTLVPLPGSLPLVLSSLGLGWGLLRRRGSQTT